MVEPLERMITSLLNKPATNWHMSDAAVLFEATEFREWLRITFGG